MALDKFNTKLVVNRLNTVKIRLIRVKELLKTEH